MQPQQKAQQEEHQHQQYSTTHHLKATCKVLLQFVLGLVLLMGPSGDWTWKAAWLLFFAPTILVTIPSSLFMRAYNPDLISERQKALRNEGTAWFERFLVPAGFVSIPLRMLAAGLQRRQQLQQPGWTSTPFLSTPTQRAAVVVLVLALALQCWSICVNKYFSSVVRIQTDRGHKVCSQGPYAWVRHPGYVGFGVQGIAESVLLQSSLSMVLSIWFVVVLLVRTVLEDAFLQKSLPGYGAYSQRVKCRWVPLLW